MTDDRVETMMDSVDEGEIAFQDYFVRRAHAVAVRGVRFRGAADGPAGARGARRPARAPRWS